MDELPAALPELQPGDTGVPGDSVLAHALRRLAEPAGDPLAVHDSYL